MGKFGGMRITENLRRPHGTIGLVDVAGEL